MSMFDVRRHNTATTVVTFAEQVLGGPEAVELADILRTASSEGTSAVVFDLARVRVMNSSGLGMLVSSLTSLKKANVSLRLATVPEKVMSLLTMTHLVTVFEIRPNVADAVAE